MRVTIDHREVPGLLGKTNFYVDCTVAFSEAEKAVIRNRQLGRHSISVFADIPIGAGIIPGGYVAWGLTIVSRLSFIVAPVTMVLAAAHVIGEGWMVLAVAVAVAAFAYKHWASRRWTKSVSDREITLNELMRTPKFTVHALDAYVAQNMEKSICGQLYDLKQRMIAVAPNLATS